MFQDSWLQNTNTCFFFAIISLLSPSLYTKQFISPHFILRVTGGGTISSSKKGEHWVSWNLRHLLCKQSAGIQSQGVPLQAHATVRSITSVTEDEQQNAHPHLLLNILEGRLRSGQHGRHSAKQDHECPSPLRSEVHWRSQYTPLSLIHQRCV